MESKDTNLNSFDFIKHLSEGVIICKERRVAAINERALDILEAADQEEIINSSIENCIDIEDSEIPGPCENAQGLYRCRITPVSGRSVGSEIYITPLGEHVNMIIIKNIFKLENLEETNKKLKTSEKIYKWLLGILPEAVIIYDENMIITYCNKAAASFVGADDYKILLGKSFMDFIKIHTDDGERVSNRIKILEENETTVPFLEQRLTRMDGKQITAEIAGRSFVIGDSKNIMIIIRDITERKALDKKIRQSEEWYKKLVEESPDALLVTRRGEYVFVNNAAARLMGAESFEKIIGKKMEDYCHPDNIELWEKYKKEGYKKESNNDFVEQKFLRSDGKSIDIEVISAPFMYDGKEAIISLARDITERKKAQEDRRKLEEALEHDKLKTEFFSNISHELKTPLNIILGAIQLMNSIHPEENACGIYNKFADYIKMMKQNCYRLLRLINNLIDITRLDAGFLKINMSNQDIISVVEDITQSVAEYTKSKDITLVFDTDTEERVIAFDPDKIERVMLNLLSNAIKFNKPGGSIEVNIINSPESVRISVRDTGIGIPVNMQERIFQRFRQVDNLFTRSVEGSGIGLSLVKSLIEAQGGTVSLRSLQGDGSEFIVELPVGVVRDSSVIRMDDFKKHDNVERINVEFSDIYS